jgi:hypothetical protein
MLSDFREVISRLENQKAAIDRAIAILREFDEGSATETPAKKVAAKTAPKKRVMSAAGKKAIGDAVRRRWAAVKAAKKVAKKAA